MPVVTMMAWSALLRAICLNREHFTTFLGNEEERE